MSEFSENLVSSYHRLTPYEGEFELRAEDLQPGDVVRFVHEYDSRRNVGYSEEDVVILAIREGHCDTLGLTGGIMGFVDTQHMGDKGLEPYQELDNGLQLWNPTNHTQSLGVRVSPTLLSKERAEGIKRVLDGMSDLQARAGIVPAETTTECFALDAFVKHALEGSTGYGYQFDLKNKSSAED